MSKINAFGWAVLDAARDAGHTFTEIQSAFDPALDVLVIRLSDDGGKNVFFRLPEIEALYGVDRALAHLKKEYPEWLTKKQL